MWWLIRGLSDQTEQSRMRESEHSFNPLAAQTATDPQGVSKVSQFSLTQNCFLVAPRNVIPQRADGMPSRDGELM
jgi:hypothetical protein